MSVNQLPSTGRRLAANASWLLLDRAIRILLGVTIGAWVARHLGPDVYGRLSFSVALVAILAAVANLGADPVIVRDLARDQLHSGEVVGTAFAVRLFAGVIAWCAGIIIAYALGGRDRDSALLTGIVGSSLVFQAADSVDLWFQSQGENKRTVIPKLLAYSATTAFKVVLIIRNAPIEAFAGALAADTALGAFGLFTALRRFPLMGRWRATVQRAGQLIGEASPFLLSNIAILMYMRIDQIMVRYFCGNAALGEYSAALSLSSFPGFLPILLNTVFAPRIAAQKMASEESYRRDLNQLFRLYAGLALLVAVCLAVLAPLAIRVLFGRHYAPAASILSVHGITNVFIFLGVAQNLWIVNEQKGSIAIYKAVCGLAACVAFNVVLIPRFGAIGAAVSAVLVQAIASVGINALVAPQVFAMQIRALVPGKLFRASKK